MRLMPTGLRASGDFFWAVLLTLAPMHTTSTSPPHPAIGVDLGGTKIEAVVLDAAGQSRWRERIATPAGDYRATLATIQALVQRAEADLGLTGCSVGVGTPGTATAAGLIKNANSTCLNGQPLQSDLAQTLGRPVRIANDANCLALSEATDGAAADASVVFAVILGTGVGAGVVVNGQQLSGPNGLAGEWGHNPLPWAAVDESPGPACYCGRHGCIETWLSGPGMARDHAAHTGERFSAQQIGARAAEGDAACEATLQRYESRLARSLAHVINLLDPHVIVLGGGLSHLDRLFVNVPRRWGEFVFSGGLQDPVRTELKRSLHGDSSGVRGAAWLWRTP
jgi:fructokinase